MSDTWQRHPLLAGFTLSGGESDAAYGPRAISGWTFDEHGDPDVTAAWSMLHEAAALLSRALVTCDDPGRSVDIAHADDLISARLLAAAAAATMTRVRAWAVFTTFAAGWGELAQRRTVWSSHRSQVEASEWRDAWAAHYVDRGDYEWHVDLIPVDVATLRRPGAAPQLPAR